MIWQMNMDVWENKQNTQQPLEAMVNKTVAGITDILILEIKVNNTPDIKNNVAHSIYLYYYCIW